MAPVPSVSASGPVSWAARRDRPFQPGLADGWVNGESREERHSKTLLAFLPRDYVAQQIAAKEREIAMLRSCVQYDDVVQRPEVVSWYTTTPVEYDAMLTDFECARQGAGAPLFGTPGESQMDQTGQ